MLDHLHKSGSYKKLSKDLLKNVAKEVVYAMKSSLVMNPLRKNLIGSNPLSPMIYGLPKIHKEGAPLRPILNTIGGPTYFLAKFLAYKLKPLVGCTSSFVKDSTSFIHELKDLRLELDDLLVNFDVVSIFTKIPINEAINVIKRIIDDDIAKLVGLCLTSTFFSFQVEFYEQTCGVSMGSPLSPLITNLFME